MRGSKYLIWSSIGIIIIFLLFKERFNITQDQYMHLLYSVLLLTFLLLGLFSKKISFGHLIKSAFAWIGIFFVILLAYAYRHDFQDVYHKVQVSLNPSKAQLRSGGIVEIGQSLGGHYKVDAFVGRKKVHFLIDTGASSVTLTKQDALRLGVDINKLNFSVVIYTANGVNKAAYIVLPYVRVGDIKVKNVKALVAQKGLNVSLLGMTFLNRLSYFSFDDGRLVFKG